MRRPAQATLAWLLAVVLIPYVGLPLFLALGTRKERRPSLVFPLTSGPGGAGRGRWRRPHCPTDFSAATGCWRRRAATPSACWRRGAAYAALNLVDGVERSVWIEAFVLVDGNAGWAPTSRSSGSSRIARFGAAQISAATARSPWRTNGRLG